MILWIFKLLKDTVAYCLYREHDPFALTQTEIQYGEKVAEIMTTKFILRSVNNEIFVGVAKRQMEEKEALELEIKGMQEYVSTVIPQKNK